LKNAQSRYYNGGHFGLPQNNLEPMTTGANPTTSIYNATGSQARFENKNILFYFEKRSSLL
jgi:hypothetical protein